MTALADLWARDTAAGHARGEFHPLPTILPRALAALGYLPDTPLVSRRPSWGGRSLSVVAEKARVYRALYTLEDRGFVEAMSSQHGRLRVFRISASGLRALELVGQGKPIPLYG